tara:strand:- start:2789 stop:3724 length:936 start_codon:yes stop_codon:yes gene_type:complete
MSNMEITGGHLKWGLERDAPTMIGYISHVPLVPRTRGGIMPQLLSFREAHPDKLIAMAANLDIEDRKALVQTGMAVFDDPTVATQAVAKLIKTGQAHSKPASQPSAPGDMADLDAALAKTGIERVRETLVGSADEAVAQLDGTMVLKLSAPSLLHKTELDGVRTDLHDEAAIRAAFTHLRALLDKHAGAHPGLCINASPQIDGVEMLIGVRHDPNFGPLVLLGSGGVDCEIFDDLTYRKAPFGAVDATAMVDALQTKDKLGGWRGEPAVDRSALEAALVAVSQAAHQMPSFEINPLIITTNGLKAVDLVVS